MNVKDRVMCIGNINESGLPYPSPVHLLPKRYQILTISDIKEHWGLLFFHFYEIPEEHGFESKWFRPVDDIPDDIYNEYVPETLDIEIPEFV